MEQRIPKIIHYCWFGGNPKPQLVLKCIESWKKYCPDYEIIEWNEDNFDIHSSELVEEAYQAKKWAFVSDYARACKLLQYGGVYLDTDYELRKPLDPMLFDPFFAGFEANDTLGSAIIGCEKNSAVICDFFAYYQGKHFKKKGEEGITTSPIVLTEVLEKDGLKLNGKRQSVAGSAIYPKAVFYPTGIAWVHGKYGKKTIGVHHYMDSWGKNAGMRDRPLWSKIRLSVLYQARNLLGTNTIFKLGQKVGKFGRHK